MINQVHLIHDKNHCIRAKHTEIVWTRDMLDRFIVVYNSKHSDYSFVFDGHVFVSTYAKYLIEYLKPLL